MQAFKKLEIKHYTEVSHYYCCYYYCMFLIISVGSAMWVEAYCTVSEGSDSYHSFAIELLCDTGKLTLALWVILMCNVSELN